MANITRRDRIRLLLSSYVDAIGASRNPADIRVALESRPPPRSELWEEGSYFDLAQALDRLRVPCPKIRRHTIGFYVEQEPWAQKRTAERGVSLLAELMPRNIFVPQELSIKAGFTPGDSRAASRWKKVAA